MSGECKTDWEFLIQGLRVWLAPRSYTRPADSAQRSFSGGWDALFPQSAPHSTKWAYPEAYR